MVSLTLYKSIYDNKTNKRMDFPSFSDFEELLYKLSKEPLANKKAAQLITPATYQPDTTRANTNVFAWAGWAAVDVDEDAEEILKGLTKELYYVCYSTASSTTDNPKFRLVFPLTSDVPADKIKHFWYALNKELGDIGDAQTKDLSRMYYIPGTYEGANNFIFTNKGSIMYPQIIMDKFTYVSNTGGSFLDSLPEAIRNQIVSHRKNAMTNTTITWHNYKDCPFVNRKMVNEYKLITETGWYAKMYAIMVNIASNALRKKYPITAGEITTLCKEIDNENGNWYAKRPFDKEADRAIEWAYGNCT
jgi:hypothetical protein